MGWIGAGVVTLTALLAPAFWNRFPLVFYDTGGYLARPFEGTLLIGRSAVYGTFLAAGIPLSFWPNLVVQAGVIIWLLIVTFRIHDVLRRPWPACATVCGLALLTGLPWYAAQLMPDILVPAEVLSLYLLAFADRALGRGERAGLVAIAAGAIACHMSILALALGLLVVMAGLRWWPVSLKLQRPVLALPALSMAAGILVLLIGDLAVAGRPTFTPGGWNIVFARLVQDGTVARYLADRCPDQGLRLCAYRDALPTDGALWLWHESSPLPALGGADAFEPEAKRIVLDSLRLYPFAQLKNALVGTVEQFFQFRTAQGLTPYNWNLQWTLERFAPNTLAGYLAGRQATGPFDFSMMNMVHVPIALGALGLLPVIILLGAYRRIDRRHATLATFVLIALIGNAAICGIFSIPDDRYQSRVVWLAPLVVAIAVTGARRR